MSAGHIDWLCPHVGILRLGGAYGEPFYWSLVVRRESKVCASIHGLAAETKRKEWRGVADVLASCGFERFWFYRMRHGKAEKHEHSTRGGKGQITRRAQQW